MSRLVTCGSKPLINSLVNAHGVTVVDLGLLERED